jgi:hypothetical protein
MAYDVNIATYLTPESQPFFEHVMAIVKKMEEYYEKIDTHKNPTGTVCNIYIFGGFIRDLITHYFKYQQDNTTKFVEFKDIDLWFYYPDKKNYGYKNSMTTWNWATNSLFKIMKYHKQ